MVNFFSSQSRSVPTKWATANYIPNAIRFLKFLGSKGMEEAERLQDLDAAGIYEKIQSVCPELVILPVPHIFFPHTSKTQICEEISVFHRFVFLK